MKTIFNINSKTQLLILSLYCTISFSQENPAALLPDLTPPSPEAFAFTKYSSEINEFSGKANVNIPIYTFKAGQLNLPVTLNYNSSGVRVDDLPTWTGMNWVLNTGGVITRVVKNLADEYFPRLYMTDTEISSSGASDCAPNASVFSQFHFSPLIDTERDIFQFNFNGFSGSFYLDQNLKPVVTKNENPIKIEILGTLSTQNEFLITTPDGVKFYFGGTNAIEKSSSTAHSSLIPTAFYLTKIEHPIKGTILIEYDTIVGPNFFKLNKVSYGEYPVEYGLIGGCVTIRDIYFYNKVQNQRTIKKIKSLDNSEEIIFNNTSYTNENFKKVLNSIEVKNGNTLTKKIDFTYQSKTNNLESDSRFFLTRLEIDKAFLGSLSSKKYQEFNFEYDDPFDLPNRLSNGQDMFGYYNGKTLNASLLPDNETVNYLRCSGFANRYANSFYAKKGSLKKITYPTGGYTTFEYESNPSTKKKYTYSGTTAFRNVESLTQLYGSIPHLSSEIVMPEGFMDSETLQNDLGLTESMYATQKAIININLSVLNYTNINSLKDRATFNVIDLSNNQSIGNKTLIIESSHILNKTSFIEVNFEVGKHYKIEVTIPETSTNVTSLYAGASLTYLSGVEPAEGAGLRLKRQKEFALTNTPVNQKRYYYCPVEYYKNPIDVYSMPDKIYPSFDIIVKPQGNVENQSSVSIPYIGMYSNLTNQNMQALGGTDNQKVYKYVTTSYGGDNFENGGIQKEFNVLENNLIARINTIPTNDITGYGTDANAAAGGSLLTALTFARRNMRSYETDNRFSVSGNCIKERYFKKINNDLYIAKDILHLYNNIETKEINNLVIKDMFITQGNALCNGVDVYPISTMYIGYYKTFTFNNFIASSITKEYFNPIAIINKNNIEDIDGDYDFSNVKTISTTQTYEYGSLMGLPTKITTTKSDGTTQSIENVYVNQYASLNELTSPQTSAYTALLAQNNVATPIEEKQLDNNGILLSKKRTTYKILSGNKVVPEIIQTAKGNLNLEERAIFEEYDSKGNPTLVSLSGGTKIKYLYNANNQVIAKIENFTGTLDPNTTTISDACNFINQYPSAQTTVFEYDPVTNLLTKITNPNCKVTTYVYDAFHRLKQIIDNDGNVVKEFDNNYKN